MNNMRFWKIFLTRKYWIILLPFLFCACLFFNNYSKYKIVQQLALNCNYYYKNKKIRMLKGLHFEDCNVTNCFFLNDDLVCISTDFKVYFYNIKKDKMAKVIPFEEGKKLVYPKKGVSKLVNSYDTIATKKNNNNEIYIFSYGKIYEYSYDLDKLKLIYEGFDNFFPLPEYSVFYCDRERWGDAPPSYCKSRNSFFYTVAFENDDKTEFEKTYIKEFSLNDFTVKDIVEGYRPYVMNNKNTLYYINKDENEVREMDLTKLEDKSTLFSYHLPIFYFVPNKNGDKIVFIHRSKRKNIKEVYDQKSKLWDGKKNKIKHFSNNYWAITSDIIFPEDM